MQEVKVKLPKNWKRWLEKAGLRITRKYKRNWWSKCYMEGYNRRWRVDCYGHLDCSCLNSDFDRWANSCNASQPFYGYVTNEKDFVALVKCLLAEARAFKEEDRWV